MTTMDPQFNITPQTVHAPIKVRCPQCFKLFSVQRSQIQTPKPRFQCTGCQKEFWMSMNSVADGGTVIGFPIEPVPAHKTLEREQQIHKNFFCSSCGFANTVGAAECRGCGVVFEKLREQKFDRDTTSAPSDVRRFWQQVLADFQNQDKHMAFFNLCIQHKCLDFAAGRYQKILQANPSDELAAKIQSQVVGFVSSSIEVPVPEEKRSRKGPIMMTTIILIMGAMLTVMGFMMPVHRNLIGLGAAVICGMIVIRKLWARQIL